ncbi:MAG: hypothetical protein IKP17_06955 [Oscillospiraceae bacterium]|nr:hypothetical protein [Oscillospiraceae bacterium]
MEKNVVHLFGASGSGTSALGRAIGEKTGWFFMDTDDYFWAPTDPPFTAKRAAPERLKLLRCPVVPVDGGLPVEVNFGILQRYL